MAPEGGHFSFKSWVWHQKRHQGRINRKVQENIDQFKIQIELDEKQRKLAFANTLQVLCFYKRYFVIDEQIAPHFVQ